MIGRRRLYETIARPLKAAGALGIVLGGLVPSPVAAMTRTEKTFGSWDVVCVQNDDDSKRCSMIQSRVTADKKQTDFRRREANNKASYVFESAYEIVVRNAKANDTEILALRSYWWRRESTPVSEIRFRKLVRLSVSAAFRPAAGSSSKSSFG